jgi:alpha-glucoside transport system permease protein
LSQILFYLPIVNGIYKKCLLTFIYSIKGNQKWKGRFGGVFVETILSFKSNMENRIQSNSILKIVASLLIILVNAIFNYAIFQVLTIQTLNPIAVTVVAILWGTIGIFLLFLSLNAIVSFFSKKWYERLQPYVFVGPGLVLIAWLLFYPTLRTIYMSFFNADGSHFVGLENFISIFTQQDSLIILRNTLMWVVFGTFGSVFLGLVVAILAERSSFEKLAKSIVFMPMAISFVGAGIIWKFIYDYRPGSEQIGLLNAIVEAFGGHPQAWLSYNQPWNNLFLIIIMIWMQAGFAMVILSAAIKGVPSEILEAARMDGAGEIRIFFKIIVPYIQSTIVTVTTTILIFSMKIFDIVMVMTGGQYRTGVIGTQFYQEFFTYQNQGYGSALAVFLLIVVIPVIWVNTSKYRKQEGF